MTTPAVQTPFNFEGDRYILVWLEPGLHPSRSSGIMSNIALLPGVEFVVRGGPGGLNFTEHQLSFLENRPERTEKKGRRSA